MTKPEHCSESKKTQCRRQISGHMDLRYHQIQLSELYPKSEYIITLFQWNPIEDNMPTMYVSIPLNLK